MHESLEKIKEYCSYYDWYDHVSLYDMKYLIAQVEKLVKLENKMTEYERYKYECIFKD